MSVAARVDGDHFELPPTPSSCCVTCGPPTSSGSSKRSPKPWRSPPRPRTSDRCRTNSKPGTVTVRLQRQPGYEAMIQRMQRRERGVPVDLDKLRRPRG
jgi:hypothetical protein